MLKTPTNRKKQKRNEKIIADLKKLKEESGAMPTACIQAIQNKYGLSRSQIYTITNKMLNHGKSL